MNIFDQFDSAGNVFDQFDGKKKDPKIGEPEELSFAEKYIAPVLEKIGVGDVAGGNLRGSRVGGFMQGAADPGVAAVQVAAHLLPGSPGEDARNAVDQAIKDKEAEYQAARASAGRGGLDVARIIGAGATSSLIPIGGAPATIAKGVGKGAAVGAGMGLLDPVTDTDNFWTEKGKQTAIGFAGGAVVTPLASALARIVSPKASTNESLALLRNEGVEPTVGQTLGGMFNSMEEKAMSLPVVGDMIRGARGRALAGFNEAAHNRVLEPIGGKAMGVGQEGYARTSQAVSDAYNDALGKVTHVNFATPTMVQKLGQLEQMAASGLPDQWAGEFRKLLDQNVAKRISPNGSMLPDFYKKLDADLGEKAHRYMRSTDGAQQEFGDAVKQLQQLFREEVALQNPQFAHELRSADKAFSYKVPVRDAVKRAVNDGGVFTPSQLNMAIAKNSSNESVARGSARLQDLAAAGADVLPNRVPNSGSIDRAAMIAAMMNPGAYVPAAIAGVGAYTRPVQNALRAMVANRPANAPRVANALRRYAPRLAPAEVAALEHRDR